MALAGLKTSGTKKQIGILDIGYKSYAYEEKFFSENGYDLKLYNGAFNDTAAKIEFAAQCTGLLVRMTVVDNTFLNDLSNLKALVRYGIGYDNIDLKAATERGIPVANVQGYATNSVSDHTIALLYACIRGITLAGQTIESDMTKPPIEDIFELHDKTLGIIGLGRIGRSFCLKVNNHFNRVLACDPYIENEDFKKANAVESSLDNLLKNSHVISLHCNLTEETRHILNEKSFASMRLRPIILNTARGAVIKEGALKEALERNTIHSAGLDVFEDEPLTDQQDFFLSHPRVVTTGHYAWYSEYAAEKLQKRAARNMLALLKGEKVADQLNEV